MGEKIIMFQNGDEGYENICIVAKFRDLKFYYFVEGEEDTEYEDINEMLEHQLDMFEEDSQARKNLARRIIRLEDLLIMKFNNATGKKLRTML